MRRPKLHITRRRTPCAREQPGACEEFIKRNGDTVGDVEMDDAEDNQGEIPDSPTCKVLLGNKIRRTVTTTRPPSIGMDGSDPYRWPAEQVEIPVEMSSSTTCSGGVDLVGGDFFRGKKRGTGRERGGRGSVGPHGKTRQKRCARPDQI